jgi:hypothetical protein
MADVDLNACPLAAFDELLTEQEACERFSHLLSDRELREARRKGEIAFVTGKKGQISYRPNCLAEYLKRKITPCRPPLDASGNTEIIGSAVSLAPTTSMPVGGTSEQDGHVAEHLRRKFLPKLKIV